MGTAVAKRSLCIQRQPGSHQDLLKRRRCSLPSSAPCLPQWNSSILCRLISWQRIEQPHVRLSRPRCGIRSGSGDHHQSHLPLLFCPPHQSGIATMQTMLKCTACQLCIGTGQCWTSAGGKIMPPALDVSYSMLHLYCSCRAR